MKDKLQCDNCGGNLIHSENDIFICSHCGTGYKIHNSKPAVYVDNIIRDNGLNPNKIANLSSEFRSFCNRREMY